MIPPSWFGFFRRLRGDIHYCLTSIAILTAGTVLIAAAIGLSIFGGFLWLSTQMQSHLAALVIAGGLFFIGAVTVSAALLRKGHPTPKPDASGPSSAASTEIIFERMMQIAFAEVARAPIKAAFAAAVLGVVVGLLRGKKTP
jgi:hypothetical protein